MQPPFDLRKTALILALLLSLAGLGFALYELLSPRSGTTGTAGAMLVTGATALLALAAAILAFMRLPGWLAGLLLALLLIGAAATAAAGYFLMANYLVAAMLGVLLAGLAATLGGRSRDRVSA